MIVDQLLRLADSQQLGGALVNTLTVSTNIVNLSQVRDLGQGQILYAHFYVNSEFLGSGGSATVQFQVRVASTSDLVTDSKIVGVSDSFVCTTSSSTTGLPTGARIIVPIGGNIDWLRSKSQLYLGASYAVLANGLAADPKCRVTVDLCLDHQDTYGWNPAPGTASNPVWGSVYPKSFTII
jgi:hypothetical protein